MTLAHAFSKLELASVEALSAAACFATNALRTLSRSSMPNSDARSLGLVCGGAQGSGPAHGRSNTHHPPYIEQVRVQPSSLVDTPHHVRGELEANRLAQGVAEYPLGLNIGEPGALGPAGQRGVRSQGKTPNDHNARSPTHFRSEKLTLFPVMRSLPPYKPLWARLKWPLRPAKAEKSEDILALVFPRS